MPKQKNAAIGRAAALAGHIKPKSEVRIKYDRDPLRARGVGMEPPKTVTGYIEGFTLMTNDHRETPWTVEGYEQSLQPGSVVLLQSYRGGMVDGWMVGTMGAQRKFTGRFYATAKLARLAMRRAKKPSTGKKIVGGRIVK